MARSRGWSADAVPDQAGRRVVVTGGGRGLGFEVARVLAGRGAQVVLGVRDLDRGRRAAAEIERAGSGAGGATPTVEVRRLDVADLASVRAFAEGLGPVAVLVNNAGVMGVPLGLTVDGFETHLGTNHLGHFALTNLLLPRLRDRVVVISSHAHRWGHLDLDDLTWQRRRYRPLAAYAASKLANLLFLAELQRRLTAAGSTLRALAAHPGSTATAITANTGHPVITWVGAHGHRFGGMPAWKGALPILYAATADLPGNSFIGPDGFRELVGWPTSVGRSRAATDPALARALWCRSAELTGTDFALSPRT